jgi:hypothetical protein
MSANRLRLDTSRRLKVRRSRPVVSRTSQWPAWALSSVASSASDGGGVAAGLQQPGADLRLVGAHLEDRVLQFARHRQRIPGGAGGLDAGDVGWAAGPAAPAR